MKTHDRRTAVAVALTVLAMVTSGCGTAYHKPPVAAPMPAGAEIPASPRPTRSAPACDPRASLAPSSTPPASITARPNRKFRVGVEQTTPRMSYRDPVTGKYQGFDIDLALEIAKAMFPGRSPDDTVVFVGVLSSERQRRLNDNTVDMVAESMTATCERVTEVAFSTDYLDSGQAVLVRGNSPYRSIADLSGKKVCAPSKTTSIDTMRQRPEWGLIPVAAPSNSDCLVMLQQGQVEAISTDHNVLLGIRELDTSTRILTAPPPSRPAGDQSCMWNKDPDTCSWLTDEPHALAFRTTDTDFVRFVNGVLDKLRASGRWQDLHDRWLKEHPDKGPPPARYLPNSTWPF